MEVSETVSALSELLNRQPLSARQAAQRAERMGIPLRYGTIAGYWSGRHGRPTKQTLRMLAEVMGIGEGELQEAAWHRRAPLGAYVPTDESIHLSERQRRALDELIRSIVESARATSTDGGAVVDEMQDAVVPFGWAAPPGEQARMSGNQ